VNGLNTPPAQYHSTLDIWLPVYNSPWIVGSTGHTCTRLLVLSICAFMFLLVSNWGLRKAAERLVCDLRVSGFRAMLRQDASWLDRHHAGSLSGELAHDVLLVKDLTCNRLAPTVQAVAMMSIAVVLMMEACWVLTLCLLSLAPVVFLVQLAVAPYLKRNRKGKEVSNKAAAESLVFEGLGNIRTVVAFGLEDKMLNRYTDLLQSEPGGLASPLMFLSYAGPAASCLIIGATVVLGNRLVGWNVLMPQDVMRVLMPLLWCWMGFGRVTDYMQSSQDSASAVNHLLETVDRVPCIDPYASDGLRLERVEGEIVFQNVFFQYPTRPGLIVVRGLDLHIEPQSTVALVGASGNGKSTVLSLILRLYDPDAGSVMLDGVDLRKLSVAWLRDQIGCVSQEPALFGGSILDNIKYGRTAATEEEVVSAAKSAGVHAFVCSLPDGYGTQVGARGGHLSGGEKQRIAIARALIRAPAVFLFDEPTSAADVQTEKELQEEMFRLVHSSQRTTVIIAHRLSTIRGADKICVMDGGSIVEAGTHQELIGMPDSYYQRLMQLSH